MKIESLEIPGSYQSYLETFEAQPELALQRLETRVEKRNAGAVGYFFLSWLHLKNGNHQQALEHAFKAKVRAPGSQLINRLHYYISHPDKFEAWAPGRASGSSAFDYNHAENTTLPIQDLDLLIHKLSSASTHRIRLDATQKDQPSPDLSEQSSDVDDIVTETLAVIHEKQGNYSAAIRTYKKLQQMNPGRNQYFAKKISRIQKKAGDKS